MTSSPVPQRRGALLLIVILVVGVTALILSLTIAMRSIGEVDTSLAGMESQQAQAIGDSCEEEALLKLSQDATYTGENFSIGSGGCVIAVTGSGNNRTVTITATVSRWTRKVVLTARVSPHPVKLLTWQLVSN